MTSSALGLACQSQKKIEVFCRASFLRLLLSFVVSLRLETLKLLVDLRQPSIARGELRVGVLRRQVIPHAHHRVSTGRSFRLRIEKSGVDGGDFGSNGALLLLELCDAQRRHKQIIGRRIEGKGQWQG